MLSYDLPIAKIPLIAKRHNQFSCLTVFDLSVAFDTVARSVSQYTFSVGFTSAQTVD